MDFAFINGWKKHKNYYEMVLFKILYNNSPTVPVIDFHVWLLNFEFFLSFPKKLYHNDLCRIAVKESERKRTMKAQTNHKIRRMMEYLDLPGLPFSFSASCRMLKPVTFCPYCKQSIITFQFVLLEFQFYKHPREPKYNAIRTRFLGFPVSYTYLRTEGN